MTLSSMRVSVYLLTACDIAVSSCPAICLGRNAPALLSAVVKTVMVVRMACLSCCSAQTGICAECDVKVRHNMICCNRGSGGFSDARVKLFASYCIKFRVSLPSCGAYMVIGCCPRLNWDVNGSCSVTV